MKLGLITLFPEMFTAVSEYGITGRSFKQGIISLTSWNPRTFTTDKHQTVDDRPYGGGPGMVMMAAPLSASIRAAKKTLPKAKVIYLSPQGKRLDQKSVGRMATQEELILLCGRYEGIDERLLENEIDEEWSIGDYILSGGELAAMVLIDAIVRLLPGSLGHEQSAEQDSFSDGLLDWPHYTRPENFEGKTVPSVLTGGNHEVIRRWRLQQSLIRTKERRPDLFIERQLNKEEAELLGTHQVKSSNAIER